MKSMKNTIQLNSRKVSSLDKLEALTADIYLKRQENNIIGSNILFEN